MKTMASLSSVLHTYCMYSMYVCMYVMILYILCSRTKVKPKVYREWVDSPVFSWGPLLWVMGSSMEKAVQTLQKKSLKKMFLPWKCSSFHVSEKSLHIPYRQMSVFTEGWKEDKHQITELSAAALLFT